MQKIFTFNLALLLLIAGFSGLTLRFLEKGDYPMLGLAGIGLVGTLTWGVALFRNRMDARAVSKD